jgi:glycerol-3-phosphate acyltransferase PlsY
MAVLIFIRHKDNISRLLKGQEPRIGKKKTAEAPPPTA